MPKLKSPGDIEYLSLQGGGGLGFAFLGAVQALEALQVLPVKPGIPGRVRGISGTSAGAITAMLLALGCTSKDLGDIFSSNKEFDAFFDGPDKGKCRGVTPGDDHAVITVSARDSIPESLAQAAAVLYDLIVRLRSTRDELIQETIRTSTELGNPMAALVLTLALGLSGKSWTAKLESQVPFLRKVFERPADYLFNLTNDRGLFPGFEVRKYLMSKLRKYVSRIPSWRRYPRLPDPGTMNFTMFRDLTGLNLVVCATNVSQRRAVLFSADTTPEFSVAEAVGMSACFPLVFKPVLVRASAGDRALGPLRGLWLDGGILNNIPIHSFDEGTPATARKSNAVKLLNPHVLGLRLVSGAPRTETNFRDPDQDENPLLGLAGDLYETLMVPGREGQFRTPEEKDQTIDLFTYGLSLFEFAPGEGKAAQSLKGAREEVLRYFGRFR